MISALAGHFSKAALIISTCVAASGGVSITHDINLDGLKDRINVKYSNYDSEVTANFVISYEDDTPDQIGSIESDTGHLGMYAGHVSGEIIVDYSNRSSRDSSDLSYDVYRWSDEHGTLCLHSSVYGEPANQLSNELFASDLSISLYEGCAAIGGEGKAEAATQSNYSLDGIAAYTDMKMPEWVALEYANSINEKNVETLLDTAIRQEELENSGQARLIASKALELFPGNERARKILSGQE